jgi:hypothetical protein
MKKIYYILGIAMIMHVMACQEENETLMSDPVSDVVITPGYGEVVLSWLNPSSKDFYYVDIAFIDSKGFSRSEKVSHYASTDTIIGFADTNTYDFTLTAYNQSGDASAPVTVSVAPLEPAFLSVVNKTGMVPDFGGAIVTWENETGKQVTVSVSYKDKEGQKTTSIFTSFESGAGYISGLEAKEHTFEVYVSDESDNRSEFLPFVITPLAEDKIDKSAWAVIDFSSEEPAEGGNPNGLVIAAFDDELSTFWHTQWAGGSPGYPHYFVIDMEQEVTVSRFECARRQGDSRGQTECQFLVSLDGENWEDFGLFEFDSSNDAPQSYRLTSNPKARYFKYVATQGPNFFAFLSEVTIYGSTD